MLLGKGTPADISRQASRYTKVIETDRQTADTDRQTEMEWQEGRQTDTLFVRRCCLRRVRRRYTIK